MISKTSITGKLNSSEFSHLWKKVTTYKVSGRLIVGTDKNVAYITYSINTNNTKYFKPGDGLFTFARFTSDSLIRLLSNQEIFYRTDVSRSGTLSLTELRNAIMASGKWCRCDSKQLLSQIKE